MAQLKRVEPKSSCSSALTTRVSFFHSYDVEPAFVQVTGEAYLSVEFRGIQQMLHTTLDLALQ